ncbi:MAG: Holliday junction branch migration protein RuvA [Deltaproteobacteria bacterium]|nr:Holliday junction branch migration protein RuvA [Deltaproteobacteria bacterium]
MIARITGILAYKSVTHVIIDTQGIGYRVFVPLTTYYELPEAGQAVTLEIYTSVRDDAINLFGFQRSHERDLFQLMLSVAGIGPKLALNILSGISAGDLIGAVSEGNLHRLVGIPGVGRKTAERMIFELKEKMVQLGAGDAGRREGIGLSADERIREDALSALVNLGYKSRIAQDVLDRILRESTGKLTLDEILKGSLKILST